MKKNILLSAALFLSTFCSQAQTFSEWFDQKATQIQYLIKQIAAYQVYLGDAEKGYSIAQNGLTFIGQMKKGEFDLHNAFFASLEAVNPEIKKYSTIADIISMQLSIIKNFKNILKIKNLNATEINYLNSVNNNMISECTSSLTELINLVTDNTYKMKDNERLNRINTIYSDMQDRYAFAQSFASDANLLSIQRASDLNEIQSLQNMQP